MADPVVAALNGGEDHELLFTVPLALQEQVMAHGVRRCHRPHNARVDGGIPGDARRCGYPPQGAGLSRKGVIPGTDPGFPGRSEAVGGSGDPRKGSAGAGCPAGKTEAVRSDAGGLSYKAYSGTRCGVRSVCLVS